MLFSSLVAGVAMLTCRAWSCRWSQKRFKKHHDESVHKFEQELKMRVRSATGTW